MEISQYSLLNIAIVCRVISIISSVFIYYPAKEMRFNKYY